MRFIPVAVLLLGSVTVLPAFAADAKAWLDRLASAEHTQSYRGRFVYERNGSFSTHSIWHQVAAEGAVQERLLQLDGDAQEVVRSNGVTRCASGELADPVVAGQAWSERGLNPEQLAKSYELRLMGESRVAGRSAVILGLAPRDQHRFGVELHLDSETAIPLKSLLVNDRGQMLERFQFTDFTTDAAAVTAGLAPSDNCKPVDALESDKVVTQSWHSDWLPTGFNLTSVTRRRSPVSDDTVECLVYDDGLARFSVFLEALHGATVEDARSQLGPTVAVSRKLVTSDGGMMVTVVGEIPLGTAERVALSVRPGAEKTVQ
ncbi:MucB/RseB C-terminal domain-containing protein [Pseudomonas sp.]|jgi:sigma-E factor negative regulatory protein RseB|uniref:MucB/RseB C-terminal domain-containing protein n=1 Tax=Pseudomonas sp. TaxID=306 RepID=UPI00257DF8CD|nr:MucB/RseB C-terminal domain-containing protein [Pseudomonas sp.]